MLAADRTPQEWGDIVTTGSFANLVQGIQRMVDSGHLETGRRHLPDGPARLGQHPRPHLPCSSPSPGCPGPARALRGGAPPSSASWPRWPSPRGGHRDHARTRGRLGPGPAPALASPSMLHGLRHRASGHRHLLTGSAAVVDDGGARAHRVGLLAVRPRVDSQHDVGHATALYTSVLFVAFLAGLGLPRRHRPVRHRPGARLPRLVHLVGAGHDRGVDPRRGGLPRRRPPLRPPTSPLSWSPHRRTRPVTHPHPLGTAVSLLLDVRLMTQRRWGLVLLRAVVVGVLRFPLLAISIDLHRPVWLLTVAALPTAVSGIVGVVALRLVTGDGLHLGPRPSGAPAWCATPRSTGSRRSRTSSRCSPCPSSCW